MLRTFGELDDQHFVFDSAAPASESKTVVTIGDGPLGPAATIPDAHLLFTADFQRAGFDLVLRGDDGKTVTVKDYFASEKGATLLSPEGAAMSADVVAALAGPLAPGQYAQAAPTPSTAEAIGRVVKIDGNATIVRNGVTVTLNVGDPILKGDVLQTATGTLGVTFNDGSTLNLTANSRLVIDEFVYDPRGNANSEILNLVQGSLTFISGEIAHSGGMKIGTPVATMGIRGTVGGVTTANDGTVSFYIVESAVGAVLIDNKGTVIAQIVQNGPMLVVRPAGPLDILATEVQKSPAQLAAELSALQQIVSLKSVGEQIIQQFFTPADPQNPNPTPNPNPQSTDKPHTQLQINVPVDFAGSENPGSNVNPTTPVVVTVQVVTPPQEIGGPVAPPEPPPITVVVPPQNAAPLIFARAAETTNEDQSLYFYSEFENTISVADTDSATLTVTLTATNGLLTLNMDGSPAITFVSGDGTSDATMTFSGSAAAINAALSGMQFNPTPDFNGQASVQIATSDGNSTTTQSVNVTVLPVAEPNQAPVLTQVVLNENFDQENGGIGAGNFYNLQNWNVTSGSIDLIGHVSGTAYQNYYPDNGLYIDLAGSTNAYGALTSKAVYGPGTYLLTFEIAGPHRNSAGGSTPTDGVTGGVRVTLGSGYSEDFELDTGERLSVTREITLTSSASLSFADLGLSGNGNIGAILFGATLVPGIVYTENDDARAINTALTLSDADSAVLYGAKVQITGNFHADQDVLNFPDLNPYGIVQEYNFTTGILTLGGEATVAQYQAALRLVTYSNTSEDPSSDTRTISFQVDDGLETNGFSNIVTATVVVAPVEDLPNATPELTLIGPQNVRDQFDSVSYGLEAGSSSWKASWVEANDGGNSPASGEIRVATDLSNFRLMLSDDDNETGTADTIQRAADLTGATSAILSFDYRRDLPSGQGNDVFRVYASSNGTSFTLIATIGGVTITDAAYQHFSYDISAYISENTTIRFSADDDLDNGDLLYIDNVDITFPGPRTFVEGGVAVPVTLAGVLIGDTNDTHMVSAKVTIANHQDGDLLSLNGTLPEGIEASNYDSETGELTLTGSATRADYQTALQQILYSNTGDNTGTAERTVTFSVNDGEADSNVATNTVYVNGINDAPEAAPDNVIAYMTPGNDLYIPSAALLRNDVDPDGDDLNFSGVSNALDGNVAHQGRYVVFTDTGQSGGGFSYTVSDGTLPTTGHVNVSPQNAGTLEGTDDADAVIGNGADFLIGNLGADTFVFTQAGNYTINDFSGQAGQGDKILVENFSFATFEQMVDGGAIEDMSGDEGFQTRINFEQGFSVTLLNIDPAVLTADDFIIHQISQT